MKLTACGIALLALMTGPVNAAPGVATAVKHLWYDGSGSTGRIRLELEGTPEYAIQRDHQSCTIILRHAAIASPLAGSTMRFQKGSVGTIVAQRQTGDSVVIIARLRDATTWSVVPQVYERGLAFMITAKSPHAQAGASAKSQRAEASSQHDGPLNIPAIARADESPAGSPEQQNLAGGTSRVSWGTILGIGVGAVMIALIGTLSIILWVARRTRRSSGVAPVLPVERDAMAGTQTNEEVHDVPAATALTADPGEGREEPGELEDDAPLRFARGMKRGKGEIDLAIRLGSGREERPLGTRIREICPKGTTGTKRIRAAKRLGVGKGEIDLAIRLQELGSHKAHSVEEP